MGYREIPWARNRQRKAREQGTRPSWQGNRGNLPPRTAMPLLPLSRAQYNRRLIWRFLRRRHRNGHSSAWRVSLQPAPLDLIRRLTHGAAHSTTLLLSGLVDYTSLIHPTRAATPSSRPSACSAGGVLPIPGSLRQVAPGNAGTIAIEHGFDEAPVVLPGDTAIAKFAGQQILDPVPLIIAQSVAAHRSACSQST